MDEQTDVDNESAASETTVAAPTADSTPPGPEHPHRFAFFATTAFTVALALAAIALVFWGPLAGLGPIKSLIPQPEAFAIVCVLWAAAAWAPVQLHRQGHTFLIVLEEIPLLLGLVYLSPSFLVLCAVCAIGFVLAVPRKQAPIKLAFNMASAALCTALTAVVFRELLGTHSPVSIRGWAAAAAALCTAAIATNLDVHVVTKLNGLTTERRSGIQFTIEAMLTGASICLSFVVLDAAWFSLWAMVPLVLVAVLIIVAYRGYARLTRRFGSLQRLYDFSRALGTASLAPSSMRADVLQHVRQVMGTRRAMIVLANPEDRPRRVSLDEHGASGLEPIDLNGSSIVADAISAGSASLHQSGPNGDLQSDPVLGMYRDAVVAPLMHEHTAVGAIVALDREEELDGFDGDDLRLFETLAAHAVTSLARADLFEDLEHQRDDNRYQATHDALTKLPNRMLFRDHAESALRVYEGVAIVLLDIDRFKDVNDTLGHTIGDHLLKEVSERLVRAAAGRATVARLGGDEFALVIPDVGEPETAIAIVNDLYHEMSRPIRMDGLALAVTASAGIALAPEHGLDEATLLQRADIAMYLAKERHSKFELYSGEHDRAMARRVEIGRQLEHALKTRREFSVVYQPIAGVRSGAIERVEALVRWNSPVLGAISPEEFIGIAEQMGVISQISDYVITEACAEMAGWRRAGLSVGVAINMSGHEISDPGLVDRVTRALKANDLPANALTLEVTETAVMADLEQVSVVLDQLAALGIGIAIDDYGTGYSSLAYIHGLPVQELKIDRSFVTNMANESSNAIIVHSSIAMAHSLGLKVVAEGAEDEATCAALADAQCDYVQGYYLSKPMTSAQLQTWLLQGAAPEIAALSREAPDLKPRALRVVAS
jgi:diguanylate cyclase (GGDEF)-like protein